MGVKYSDSFKPDDLSELERRAREQLARARSTVKRRVFISFAHEDEKKVDALRERAVQVDNQLEFEDYSLKEPYDSEKADYIRRKIREKLDKVSVTVVYITEHSAESRWVNWEIEESLRRGKGVIGIYDGDTAPKKLPKPIRDYNCKVVKWSPAELMKAIEDASQKRKKK